MNTENQVPRNGEEEKRAIIGLHGPGKVPGRGTVSPTTTTLHCGAVPRTWQSDSHHTAECCSKAHWDLKQSKVFLSLFILSALPQFPFSDPKTQTKDSVGLRYLPHLPLLNNLIQQLFPHPPGLASNIPKFGIMKASGWKRIKKRKFRKWQSLK